MTLREETRDKLRTVSTATLTTVLLKRGFRNQFLQNVHAINHAALPMVGEAFTLRYIPAREDLDVLEAYADVEHPQRKAIEICPAGHVLVMDSRKEARAASAGDILISRLQQRGCAGIVSDGGFRDVAAIVELGFPAFHQRPSAPTGPILHHAVASNEPIGCGDVAVYPGDVMVGDGDGVVCLPAHLAEEVAAEAVEMTSYEDFVAEEVKNGRSIVGLYPSSPESREQFARWRQDRGR